MLIDQIKVLMHEIPGRIEKIIYEIQALAANGQHCWSKAVHSGEEEIIFSIPLRMSDSIAYPPTPPSPTSKIVLLLILFKLSSPRKDITRSNIITLQKLKEIIFHYLFF